MQRLISAFQNSSSAFRYVVRNETAFRQECVLLILAVPCAYVLSTSLYGFFALLGFVVLVMIVEVLNTSIEAVCDAVSEEFDANIKIAKDCGSLAVLMACSIALVFWMIALASWITR